MGAPTAARLSHTSAQAPTEAPPPRRPALRPLSLNAVLAVLATVAGAVVGTRTLGDNSFLTHLQTGRLILAGHFPRTDPYTFTAHGHPWVVQSWLVSVVFAGAEKLAGGLGIRIVVMLLCALLAYLAWRLTAPARTVVGRLAVLIPALVVGTGMWVERPLLFGLVCLALMLIVLEERRDPRWLVPILWVWVNTHGSFPLGLVFLACWALGRRLDGEWTGEEKRYVLWAVLGTLAGAIGPLGPVVLVFPLELLSRSSLLHFVIEWQSPAFTDVVQRVWLLQVVAAGVLLVRRPKYRDAFVLVVFTAAALLGSRNVVVASLVLVPGMARGLRGLGSLSGTRRSSAMSAAAVAVVLLGGVLAVSRLGGPSWDLKSYPVEAVSWLQANGQTGPQSRVITQDIVGNYLEARFDGRMPTFMDDRYDMFPTDVIEDEITLYRAGSGWEDVLHRRRPTAILWSNDTPLAQLLSRTPGWKRVYYDKKWSVYEPVS